MEDICIYSGEAVAGRIVFGHGLPGVGQALAHCTGSGKTLPVYLVYDTGVSGFVPVLETVLSGTAGVKLCGKYGMPVSEDSKTMSSVLGLAGWLLGCGADRNALVLAVGGGITTDMAGFAASIYKRGVRFAYVPTTLLAQVDAAIGGKTGVNFESYKNMLGIIRQPEFTYLCPEVLETLPERDFMSGAAELVKSFLIEDGGWYGKSVAFLSDYRHAADKKAFLNTCRGTLLELIRAAAAVKASIVSVDQFETGERRKLNLGHTFAHAIEKNARMRGDDITHGEAVSIGIVMAAELSAGLGLASQDFVSSLKADFKAAGLPSVCPYPVEELAEAMSKDKKSEDGIIHFVLLSAPGAVLIHDMPASAAAAMLDPDNLS